MKEKKFEAKQRIETGLRKGNEVRKLPALGRARNYVKNEA